ncbi:MAG: hypothetical protein CTY25_15160 [Methylobacterium sp.]|nr:MAG: hypothetical protein CTY25_15160 [Methylobacterium sp.]
MPLSWRLAAATDWRSRRSSAPLHEEAAIPTFLSKVTLWALLTRLRTSFWFLPASMAVAAAALSFALIALDRQLGTSTVKELDWLYTFGPEGARALLSAVASSMITVAGLTFSMTMLTLQLASSQFGPRMLRNFMRDRGNQVVLGTFTATFVYCLLVLRSVRGLEGSSFVPHVAVAFGVFLAIASIAVLIFFIHHIATAIRIETLLAELAAETHAAVDRLYPERFGHAPPDAMDPPPLPEGFEREALPVAVDKGGYVQRIDGTALMRIAVEHDMVIRIAASPGRFVTTGDPLFLVHPPERLSEEIHATIRRTVVIGDERTPDQDLAFSVRRIVEIAQRALSPGINDPTTALYCIDRLGEALGRLAQRRAPSAFRFDGQNRLRIVADVTTLDDLACPAFAAIARYGLADMDVVAHLLRAIDRLVTEAGQENCRGVLALAADLRRCAEAQAELAYDRAQIGAAGRGNAASRSFRPPEPVPGTPGARVS